MIFFQLVAAYAAFILALALPPLVVWCLLWAIWHGLRRVASSLRKERRLDLAGLIMVIASLALGAVAYDWWCGPRAELATLRPVAINRELATKIPRTWVFDYGAAFAVFDLVPKGHADRVLNATVLTPAARSAVSGGALSDYMEEVHIIDSPDCNAYVASGVRDANRAVRCVRESPVSKAELAAAGPYLVLREDHDDEVETLAFAVVEDGQTLPVARCEGRAPRETNPFLALIRWNRKLELARSIFECRTRAASGALARALATGEIG
ncbi:hypothetical protein AQZ52_10470 [Novosphingobium fuchskuhlense]|uniref:Uncharacterized protein n=1 Tax=Novosphingobium fuchskuhlense TaxID=1117702 RepID=A0A117UUI5_9SPHN|nr:hypothetical protein [Novosphingobium fuchskuhlense]KUR71098.1 hypothetical protein AQZ52_10470 [Novosphingobium fuchskuhlense]